MTWPEPCTNPWQTDSSTVVYRNAWTTVREDHLTGNDGRPGLYGYFDRKDSALILPLFPDGSTVLIRQWRYAFMESTWELPCGACESGEDPLLSAQRELEEEAQLTAKKWTPLGAFQPSDARVRGLTYCYLAEDLAPCAEGHIDDSELELTRARVSMQDCLAAIAANQLNQVGSAFLLQRVAYQVRPDVVRPR